MKQYITYRYRFNNNTQTDRSSPSVVFASMYPEMKWVVTITDEILSDENMKVLPNWEISGVRIGVVEVDEVLLSQFWHTPDYVIDELKNSQNIKVYIETQETLATFIRNYTTLEEVSTNKFLLSPEYKDMNWDVVPTKYLIIE